MIREYFPAYVYPLRAFVESPPVVVGDDVSEGVAGVHDEATQGFPLGVYVDFVLTKLGSCGENQNLPNQKSVVLLYDV